MRTRELKGEGGYPLSFNKILTERYKKISGEKDVQVGWNGYYNMWNLLWKGKYIMSMRSISGYENDRVYRHFRKLRSNGYDNVKEDMKRYLDKQKEDTDYVKTQYKEELDEIGQDILIKQKESVFVNGG